MSFIYSMTDTWNAIGTTFNGIQMNISNGAGGAPVGAAASRALKLLANSAPIFDVDIAGNTTIAGAIAASSITTSGVSGITAVSGPVTIVYNAASGVSINGSSTNSISALFNNSVASGRSWNIGSSGGGPAAVGNFYIFDSTAGLNRLAIDSTGLFEIVSGLLKIDQTPAAVSGVGPFLVGSGSTLNARASINWNGTTYWIPMSTTAF